MIVGVVELGKPPFDSLGMFLDEKAAAEMTAELEAYLKKGVAGVWHPVGSCRMGRSDDPLAVTGPTGRVHGLAGLRGCDASVMPTIPSANTMVPTVMLAERMADLIKAETREQAGQLAVAS